MRIKNMQQAQFGGTIKEHRALAEIISSYKTLAFSIPQVLLSSHLLEIKATHRILSEKIHNDFCKILCDCNGHGREWTMMQSLRNLVMMLKVRNFSGRYDVR